MSDRIDSIRDETHTILKPEIPQNYQTDQNVFIFTAPSRNLTFTLESTYASHFRLIDVHEATKFLKMTLCEIMTEEPDSEYFV